MRLLVIILLIALTYSTTLEITPIQINQGWYYSVQLPNKTNVVVEITSKNNAIYNMLISDELTIDNYLEGNNVYDYIANCTDCKNYYSNLYTNNKKLYLAIYCSALGNIAYCNTAYTNPKNANLPQCPASSQPGYINSWLSVGFVTCTTSNCASSNTYYGVYSLGETETSCQLFVNFR